MLKSIIGLKLKSTRHKNDMTIQDLAELSKVSSNMISRIERGLTTPSVEILMKLATAFGKSINYFVEGAEKGATFVCTRRGGGEPIFFFEDKHQITSLTEGIRDPSFAVFYDTLEKGCRSGDAGMVHTGEEFAIVVKGRMLFKIEDEKVILDEGDSVVFKATQKHSWENAYDGTTLVLWVVSPAPNISR